MNVLGEFPGDFPGDMSRHLSRCLSAPLSPDALKAARGKIRSLLAKVLHNMQKSLSVQQSTLNVNGYVTRTVRVTGFFVPFKTGFMQSSSTVYTQR